MFSYNVIDIFIDIVTEGTYSHRGRDSWGKKSILTECGKEHTIRN